MNTECPNCGYDGCDGFCDARSQICYEEKYLSYAKIPGQAQTILVGKTAAELEAEKLQARFKSLPPEFQRTRIEEYRCEKSSETCGCPVCKAIEKKAETLASKMQKSQRGSFCMDVLSCKEMDLDAGYVSYFWNKSRLSTLGIRF